MHAFRGLFSFLLLSLAGVAMAQSHVGVFAGVNSSSLAGDNPEKGYYKSLPGFNTGANLDIQLSEGILLSLQPSYSQEGARILYKLARNKEPVDSIRIRMNYISLPLLLKVQSTNARFYALGGVEAGYLSAHRISSQDEELDVDIEIETVNIAMHFGAGLRIPVGFPRLFIELRYAQGLINLTDEPALESYVPRVKTNGFKVLAGIEFPWRKSDE